MIYRLVILNGDRKGQQITVPPEMMTIGRGKDCGLALNDPEVATQHAMVEHTPHGLQIRDLGSMGKVLVNNRGVRESTLRHGDIVELGHTHLLVQAVVEADVRNGVSRVQKRRRHLQRVLIVALAALVLVAVLRWQSGASKGTELTFPGNRATNTPPAAVLEVVAPVSPAAAAVANATPSNNAAAGVAVAAPPAAPAPVPPPEPSVAVAPPPPAVPTLAPPAEIGPEGVPAEALTKQPDPYTLAQEMIGERVKGMMAEAHLLVSSNRLAEADELLGGVQRLAPDYVDAYVDRAWLCEDRGLLDPALAQWREVIRRGGAAEVVKTARDKLARLERARRECVPKFAGRIRVKATDQKKFPESAGVREMRVVTVALAPVDPMQALEAKAARVDVLFYDRDLRTDSIKLSRADGRARDLAVPAPWLEGELKSVTATYLVPESMAPAGTRSEQFMGYIVRVYYQGALQVEMAEPPGLLTRVAPELQVATVAAEPAPEKVVKPPAP